MAEPPENLPPPPKQEVALALLEGESVYIHLDPRREGVLVPKQFAKQTQLVLQVGLKLPIRIPDLQVDEEGISCTLSFNRARFWCRMPWASIYALVGPDGRGMLWPEDVPPEIAEMRAVRSKTPGAAKRPRPRLSTVRGDDDSDDDVADSSLSPDSPDGPDSGGASSADVSSTAEARISKRPRPRAVPPLAPALVAVPPPRRPVAVPSRPEQDPPPRGAHVRPPPQPLRPQGRSAGSPLGGPTGAGSQGKRPKRELPPYLRVVK